MSVSWFALAKKDVMGFAYREIQPDTTYVLGCLADSKNAGISGWICGSRLNQIGAILGCRGSTFNSDYKKIENKLLVTMRGFIKLSLN